MAEQTITFTKRDFILVLRDGAGHEKEVFMEQGDLSYDEGTPAATYCMDRGSIADGDTRDGDDEPMNLSMSLALTDMARAVYSTLHGWLTRPPGSWEASNLVSSLGVGRDYRINVDLTMLGDKRGGVEDITMRFNHWRPRLSASEGDFFTASLSGTCKSTQPELL